MLDEVGERKSDVELNCREAKNGKAEKRWTSTPSSRSPSTAKRVGGWSVLALSFQPLTFFFSVISFPYFSFLGKNFCSASGVAVAALSTAAQQLLIHTQALTHIHTHRGTEQNWSDVGLILFLSWLSFVAFSPFSVVFSSWFISVFFCGFSSFFFSRFHLLYLASPN